MRIAGITGAVRGRHHTATTTPAPSAVRHPDLVDRAWATPTRPDQWWVADFTYVWTLAGFCYVAFVIDVFSRRILGWRVSHVQGHLAGDRDASSRPLFAAAAPTPCSPRPGWCTTPTRAPRADSTGRRNTSDPEVLRWHDVEQQGGQGYRPAMRSPGRPMPSRHVQRAVLAADRDRAVTTEEAALAVGVSWPVGTRWFRHAGGMPPSEPGRAHGPLPVVRRA